MYEELLETVTNLGSPTILLVGDFMVDEYVYGDALRISPEAPVPVLMVKETKRACGGAGSVAADVADLDAKVMCVGLIGDDNNGLKIRQVLTNIGAQVDGLVTTADRPTTCKQRLIGLAQHRHRQQLMRVDSECTEPVSGKLAEQILKSVKQRIDNVDIVCLQDYNKGLLTEQICGEIISLAKKAGKKVLVDPAFDCDYSKYTGATLITPNRQETSIAVGFEVNNSADADKAAKLLCDKLKLDAAVITLDKEGAYLYYRDNGRLIPTRPRNVYDVTGAGDMVLAMLAVGLAAGCDYERAVQLSNIAGGIEVEKFGVATVTIDEIIREIIIENKSQAGKIRNIDVLAPELDIHRMQNESIVFTNGCFDVLHRGHIEFLRFCRAQGDLLVVGLNSDRSVKQIKGPERPINNQHDRAEVLQALECVDYIAIFDEPDPLNIIMKVKPDVLVKGKDWEHKGVIGREFVEDRGGKVVLADLVEGKSSTATIEKMKALKDL